MASTSQTFKFTASQKAQVDRRVVFRWPYWCPSAGKWIFTVVLALLTLSGAVLSRMSLVAIPRSKSGDNQEFQFLALVGILMVPYGVELVRCLWLHGFVSGHPWPSVRAVLVGFGVSFIEVCGVCYYTIAVLTSPDLSSTELILFTNAIFILPSLKKFFKPREPKLVLKRILMILIVLLDLAGLAWAIYKMSKTKPRIALPLSIVLISIAWFSPLRKWQTQSRHQPDEHPYDSNSLLNSSSRSSSTERLTEFREVLCQLPSSQAIIKSGIINSTFKFIAVPFVSAFFCHFYLISDLHKISLHNFGPSMGSYWDYMLVNIFSSVGVYLLGCLACRMGLQRQAFAAPLILVTPICLFLSSAHWSCMSSTIPSECGKVTGSDHYHVLVIAAYFWLGLLGYVLLYIWKPQEDNFKMAPEKDLFLIPYTYNGVFLEQYLFLNREDTFIYRPDIVTFPLSRAKVFLCTTMYHEDAKIMEQYLRCLYRVYKSRSKTKYSSLETHVVFDDAVTPDRSLNEYAKTFINLCEEILKDSDACAGRTVKMPYGRQMVITLESGMQIFLHFKDSAKVNRGKRWSQMMIMSWLIDTRKESIGDPVNTYFFTCDADVCFTSSSIDELLELMSRKPYVGGATCRVHAAGSGPVVWYQMFEYAIWNWLVQAADSVFGSVLCCSGFFSVYRLQALSEVLPVFSRPTETGADVIRKDHGEDRWLSCLLLKSGWLLDYCSSAEVSTLCPQSFDSFFLQRRHWIVSSFANTCALIKDFRKVRYFNNKLSVLYFVYLMAMVFFMVISPTVMIAVIAGTASYVLGIDLLLAFALPLMGVLLTYMILCMVTLPDVHLALAKGASYLFSILVFLLALGSLASLVHDHKTTVDSDDPTHSLDKRMGISVSLLYFIIYGSVFLVAGLLHPTEMYCCLQSLWYLICLPAFNIFLVTYAVCNIGKTDSELLPREDGVPWYVRFLKYLSKCKNSCCSCCPNTQLISQGMEDSQVEKCDKCEGVEDSDIPRFDEEDIPIEESDGEDDGKETVDFAISAQRQYWKQLLETFSMPQDDLGLADRTEQLNNIRGGAVLVFSLVNIMWFIVDYGATRSNPLGYASLTIFTFIVICQFVAMLYHRLMTIAYELSQTEFIPRSSGENRPRELTPFLECDDSV